MIEHSQLKWVKNIKRENGTAWAYMEEESSQEFQLNFSPYQRNGAGNIKVGEAILLFQAVDKVQGVKKRTYLTHLVMPVDDLLFFNPSRPKFPYERRVAVIARANPNTAIFSTPRILNFHDPNRGKICPIEQLHHGWAKDEITETIWDLFNGHFTSDFEKYYTLQRDAVTTTDSEIFSVLEGREREVLKKHLIRERNPAIIKAAKDEASRLNNGVLECESCQFVFARKYGQHGNGFIECHHRQPISRGGERLTQISDLAMVCSNCHRMLHRKNELGNYYSVEELRAVIEEHPPSSEI